MWASTFVRGDKTCKLNPDNYKGGCAVAMWPIAKQLRTPVIIFLKF